MNKRNIYAMLAVICAILFGGGSAYAEAMTLQSSTPAEGAQVAQLKSVQTVWNQVVGVMEDMYFPAKLTVKDASGTVVAKGVSGRASEGWDDIDMRMLYIDLDKTITTPGAYTINIAAGMCQTDNWELDEQVQSDAATINFTIGGEMVWPALKAVTPGLYPKNGAEFELTQRSITIQNIDGLTTDATEVEFINNGTPVKVPLTLFYGSYLCGINQVSLKPGTLSLSLPEGFFGDADYRDSQGKGGKYSTAIDATWTVIGQAGGGDDDNTPISFTSVTLDDAYGNPTSLASLTGIGIWKAGTKLRMTHNLFDRVGYQVLNIVDKATGDGVISLGQMRKDATAKEWTYAPAYDVKFYTGHEYTLTIDCYQEDGDLTQVKKYGTYTCTLTGLEEPYKFSEAKCIQTIPAEGELLTSEDQIIELLFSEAVELTSAEINAGFGSTVPVDEFYSNNKMDHWYVRLGKSNIRHFSPSLILIYGAVDMKGLVLEGTGGVEAESVTSIEWDNHFANPEVTITPSTEEEITVLEKFTVTEPKKNAINWGGATEGQLLTASGRVVTTVDNNNIELYYKGQDFSTLEVYDVEPDKVVLNLVKPVTAPGKYILNLPFGCFTCGAGFDSKTAKDIALEYILNGTPTFTSCTVKEGAQISNLGLVGWYTESEVEAVEGRNINIVDEALGEVVAQLPINVVPVRGASFIFADFTGYVNEQGEAFTPQPGKAYSIKIPRNALILPGTDMKMPAVSVAFEGAAQAANLETVTLTQSIAGHSTVASTAVKGEAVTVNITPAAGWKLATLTFNGDDVTAAVSANAYTTPALQGNSTVEATMAFDGKIEVSTGINDTLTDFRLNVWSADGAINIKGLKLGQEVEVFTVEGARISGYRVEDESVNSISIPSGIYIVVVSDGAERAAVKINHDR